MTEPDPREILRRYGLRATAPRVAVLTALREASHPLTHSGLSDVLGPSDTDRVTVYRNLHKLVEAGLARIASQAGGVARYEAVRDDDATAHVHPHFACTDCGTVECLPEQPIPALHADSRWQRALSGASVQLQGTCPDCLDGGGAKNA